MKCRLKWSEIPTLAHKNSYIPTKFFLVAGLSCEDKGCMSGRMTLSPSIHEGKADLR